MNNSNPKSKFIPPIKTAASFLKTLSDTNESNKFALSPVIEKSKKGKIERISSIPSIPSINLASLTNSRLLSYSLKFPRNQKSKSSRDVSHLQDLSKSPRFEIDSTVGPSIYILPTDLEKLKVLMQVTSSSERRLKTKGSQVCFRSSCIENFSDSFNSPYLKSVEDLNFSDFGAPSGQSDLNNLKEWFRYMKEAHLNQIIFDSKLSKSFQFLDPDRLETFDLVVRAGMKEFLRQLHVLNVDRWEILTEIIQSWNLFWVYRFESLERNFVSSSERDKWNIQHLSAELQDLKMIFKEKEIQYKKDIGVLKLETLLKEQQIQKLQENIRKLKAERIYKGKQELQRYNSVIKQMKEIESNEPGEEHGEKDLVTKALLSKKEELVTMILNKTQVMRSDKAQMSPRLTDEQLIEYEMLITNSDEIFFEHGIQTEYLDFCKNSYSQTLVNTREMSSLTDEILEVVVEESVKEMKKLPKKNYSIMVTNEKAEQIEAQTFNPSDLSENSGRNSPHHGFGDPPNWDDRTGRRRSVVGLYKTREIRTLETQTEDKYFWEQIKQDEEEITEWILQDRKNKLCDLEKQIFQSKRKLGKLNSFIMKHKGQLNSGPSLEDGTIELDSDDSFDLSEDADLEYLKSIGLIGKEADLPSWREGYYYAIEKVNGITKKKKDDDEDDSLSSDFSEVGEIINNRNLKSQRSLLGDELFKRKNTKIEEFKFQRKETKHHFYKPSAKPKFLENFLENFKITGKRIATMSKKNIMKTINSLYSSAISKMHVYDFEPLHLFVYEEFLSRYITKSAVDKKIIEFMAALVSYKDEKKISIFNRLFGVSIKNEIPRYSRPKQAFNFFVNFSRLLDSSHHGIDVGEIKGRVYIPSIRAVECTKEIHSKYFETYRLQTILNSIDKNLVSDPNKINKNLIDKEILIEILLDNYDEFNKNIEKFLLGLFEPFKTIKVQSKIHKIDLLMIIKYFSFEKYSKLFGNFPFEYIEKTIGHVRSKNYISISKAVDLCFVGKILYPDEIGNDYRKFIHEINQFDYSALTGELRDCLDELKLLVEKREKLQLDNGFISNWEDKILSMLDDLNGVTVKDRAACTIFNVEVKRLLTEC